LGFCWIKEKRHGNGWREGHSPSGNERSTLKEEINRRER